MLEIGVTFDQAGKSLGLVGRTGEDSARVIVCDCAQVLEEYPGADIVCAMRRACDAEAYAHTLTADGSARRAVLTAADVAAPGSLMIEFRAVRDGQVLKSAVYVGRVERGLAGQTAAPGNPVADVIDRLNAQAEAARKAADAAQQMADEVRRKLEAGELNGSDAEVTAENIQSALGYAPVRDVQVGGSSVLADGVANVPVAQTWVTGEKRLGVMAPSIAHGLYIDDNLIKIYPAEPDNIDRRVLYRPITPTNLDKAVTAALTDGKGPAWTAAQQAAARERMGLDKPLELIEEITLTEDAGVTRESDTDGTPWAKSAILITIISPGVSASMAVNQQVYVGDDSIYNYGVNAVPARVGAQSILFARICGNLLEVEQVQTVSKSGSAYEANTPRTSCRAMQGSKITKVVLSTMPAGTKIIIMGASA